eukprot:4135383-Amphidinium_carterae.1
MATAATLLVVDFEYVVIEQLDQWRKPFATLLMPDHGEQAARQARRRRKFAMAGGRHTSSSVLPSPFAR